MSTLHITCRTYNKHSQFFQLPKSMFSMNTLKFLWFETAAHLHTTLISKVTLKPTWLFLFISSGYTFRHARKHQVLHWHRTGQISSRLSSAARSHWSYTLQAHRKLCNS